MKNYILKKYSICSFFIFILLTFLYISINYNILSIFNSQNIYAKEVENKEVDIYETSKKENEQINQSSTSTKEKSSDDMLNLLARLINAEARGEPYIGQVAVGAVILNRVKSPKFPNTIPLVIYQEGQFTSVRDGQFNVAIDEDTTVYKAAAEAMNGADPTNGALYFYNPSKTKSKWLFSLKTTTTIGKHAFALGE